MKKFTATAAALLVTGGGVMQSATPSQAITAIVPNYFYCNWSNQCRQINGSYVASVPTYCHRVLFLNGAANRRVALCDRWV